jgi:hypothetical protein
MVFKAGNFDMSFNTIAKHIFCLLILKSEIPALANGLDRKARLLALWSVNKVDNVLVEIERIQRIMTTYDSFEIASGILESLGLGYEERKFKFWLFCTREKTGEDKVLVGLGEAI